MARLLHLYTFRADSCPVGIFIDVCSPGAISTLARKAFCCLCATFEETGVCFVCGGRPGNQPPAAKVRDPRASPHSLTPRSALTPHSLRTPTHSALSRLAGLWLAGVVSHSQSAPATFDCVRVGRSNCSARSDSLAFWPAGSMVLNTRMHTTHTHSHTLVRMRTLQLNSARRDLRDN